MSITPSSDVFVARQPIFDRAFKLVGYELLYRATARAAAERATASDARSTPVSALLSFGLETLTGGRKAFIPIANALLAETRLDDLAPDRWTIELSASQHLDADALAAAQVLRTKGFTIALED